MSADVELFFDPVCPFCWVTSKWLRQVQRLSDVTVEWRFISLAVLNDRPGAYDDKPALYPAVHGLGRRLLRVAAAARDAHGSEAIGPLYRAMGEALWERGGQDVEEFDDVLAVQARGIDVEAALAAAGLPTGLAAAQDDARWDPVLERETKEALSRVGDDVGTPILSFSPPDGPAFFGPVISNPPSDDEALRYWEALTTLARMDGFAEVKRTLRSMPVTALTEPLVGTTTTAS
jgi:2-hydroxychromene-2-carboxylate isomerase